MSIDSLKRSVVVAGVPYSSNVGDGVISDCIDSILKKIDPSFSVFKLDIAGRDGYVLDKRNDRVKLLNRLSAMPSWLRRLVVVGGLFALYQFRWKKRWLARLEGRDFLMVGGGQLIADVDLNFPIKVYGIVKAAEKVGVPVGFVCCGVGEHWSYLGRRLMKRALSSKFVKYISVRDARSVELINEILGGSGSRGEGVKVHLVPDPAVFSGDRFLGGSDLIENRSRRILGLGISSPSLLSYSSTSNAGGDGGWHQAFQKIVDSALIASWTVRVFSNGAPEDELYIDSFMKRYEGDIRVERVAVPVCGDDLLSTIASVDLVVAHRLHANIVAYGLGVPSIGLAWDEKLKSFFRLANRMAFFVGGPELIDDGFVELMEKAVSSGVSEGELLALKSQVYSGFENAVGVLTAHGA